MIFPPHFALLAAAVLPVVQGSQRPFESDLNPRIHPAKAKVPVLLGVMSACPDAIICESVFDSVLAQVGDKVDIGLTFVGTLNASEPAYGVTCLHGTIECTGNIQELCVISRYPDHETWWPFVQCLNSHGRYEVGKEDVAQECAENVGIDWDVVEECVNGTEGVQRLKDSVAETQKLGIIKSCTIFINHKLRCIRDGSWYNCPEGYEVEDFVKTIEEEFEQQ